MKNMILNLSNHQVQDILEELGMIDDNGNCPYTAEEIFKSALEYSASYYAKTNKQEWSDEDEHILSFLDTLEVIDPCEECIQYDSIKTGIKAHAETYSFNIESKLFNQLTKEQQELWREEIEQACISGGEAGVELAKDLRYKENLEAKIDTWHLQEKEDIYDAVKDWSLHTFACLIKDGTIQMFSGCRSEDCEGHINVHIDGVNDDYDNVDDIVKWIEYTHRKEE